jgi:dihydroneopterin aldolase/2-amino-4-hydroxy-6-hydroxymethyldihydropteridine diphosphokinase
MNHDEIRIENLEVFANHGVLPEETRLGQKFLISLTMYQSTRKAGKTDALENSTDYGNVAAFLTDYMKQHTCKLLEAAAEQLANALLTAYPSLKGVALELKKPWAPVGLPLETVSVKITRFWHTAYIGLGSNLGDKKAYLDGAVDALGKLPGCRVERVSSYLVTKPYGFVEQDDFLNGCLCLSTLLFPEELLEALHEIEAAAHRERRIRWGPRTLDLDLLLYDDMVLETEDLVIPHVELHKRDFVLTPLCEIAPNRRHPILKKTMAELSEALKQKGGPA